MLILNDEKIESGLLQLIKTNTHDFSLVFYSKKNRIPKSQTAFPAQKSILKEIGKWLIKNKKDETFTTLIAEDFSIKLIPQENEIEMQLLYKKKEVWKLKNSTYKFYKFGKDILDETKAFANFDSEYSSFMKRYIIEGDQRFLLNKISREYDFDCNKLFVNLIKKAYLRAKTEFCRSLHYFFKFKGTIEEFIESNIWKSGERFYEERMFKMGTPLDQQIALQSYLNRFFDQNLPEKFSSALDIFHNYDYEIIRFGTEYGEDIARDICAELNLVYENFCYQDEIEAQRTGELEETFNSRHKILFEE